MASSVVSFFTRADLGCDYQQMTKLLLATVLICTLFLTYNGNECKLNTASMMAYSSKPYLGQLWDIWLNYVNEKRI